MLNECIAMLSPVFSADQEGVSACANRDKSDVECNCLVSNSRVQLVPAGSHRFTDLPIRQRSEHPINWRGVGRLVRFSLTANPGCRVQFGRGVRRQSQNTN